MASDRDSIDWMLAEIAGMADLRSLLDSCERVLLFAEIDGQMSWAHVKADPEFLLLVRRELAEVEDCVLGIGGFWVGDDIPEDDDEYEDDDDGDGEDE